MPFVKKYNILEGISDRIHILPDAIVSEAAPLKKDDMEYALDIYHPNRIIRRIILNCPTFATTLWKKFS